MNLFPFIRNFEIINLSLETYLIELIPVLSPPGVYPQPFSLLIAGLSGKSSRNLPFSYPF